MDYNEKLFVNQPTTTPEPGHDAENTPDVEQSVSQMINMPQQATPLPSTVPHPQQVASQLPNHIQNLITACIILGIVVVISTILVAIGLATGVFTSTIGFSMVSSLLIGVIYSNVKWVGLVLCVVAFVSVLTAKKKQHISIKKPLIKIIVSAIMIYLPDLIVKILISIASGQI